MPVAGAIPKVSGRDLRRRLERDEVALMKGLENLDANEQITRSRVEALEDWRATLGTLRGRIRWLMLGR